MSSENKENYYTNNSSINMHIDNIISFRDFLNAVLTDIKSGEYNIQMIKNLSHTVEKFYNDIGENDDIFKPTSSNQNEEKKLTPKVIETSHGSDLDSDVESDITIATVSDSGSTDYPSKKSAYNISNYFSHKPYNVQSDDPDFLDDYYDSVTTQQNTKNESSLMSSYSKTREHKVVQHDYYKSLYEKHKEEVDETRNDKTEPSYPLNVKFEKTNIEPDVQSESKYADKLAEDFLNNNLELDKYHYLKNLNQERVNTFCAMSLIY